MSTDETIADLIFRAAAKYPERAALRTSTQAISFSQLQRLIVNHAAHMTGRGIGRSSCVAIALEAYIPATVLPLACSLIGCRWVQATATALTNETLGITHVIHDNANRYPPAPRHVAFDASWSTPPGGQEGPADAAFERYSAPTDTWMIGQSSGTTGTSKFMAISSANACRRSDARLLLDPSETPIAASFFHPHHAGNLFNIIRVLLKGGTFLLAWDYDFWAANGATFVIGSPNHFARLFELQPPPNRPKIRLAWLGGGPSFPHFLKTMLRYFDEAVNTYGSAEAGIVSARTVVEVADAQDAVCLGRATENTTLQIVDGLGQEVAAEEEGVVRLRTPWQVSGYIADPETTAKAFQDGWFYPGDTGFLSRAGELYITGRVNDQLNVGGTKLNPVLLDEAIQAISGVRDGICFAGPAENGVSELAAVIALEDPALAATVMATLQTQIVEKFGWPAVPRRVYFSGTVPRNANGKATRHLAAEAVRGIEPIRVLPLR